MKKSFLIIFFCLCACFTVHCGGSSNSGVYTNVNQIAVDSTNDRLFMTQPRQELFAITASTLEAIDEQPIVTEEYNEDIYALLPYSTTQLGVYAAGTTSRLFVMGNFDDSNGDTVLNQILVLNFDGTSFTQADFSPINIIDGDVDTDESDNSFSDLIVDQDNAVIYITDTSGAKLYAISATDGTAVTAPLDIAGSPQGMALDNGYLYVCNSSATDAEQVITVLNTSADTTTTIDLDVPCHEIDVQTNASGTVMFVKRHDSQEVFIHQIDSTTYAASASISSASDTYNDGYLTGGTGISSAVSDFVLVLASDGSLYGYLSELDGNIQMITIDSALSSYSLETLSTSATNLTHGTALTDTSGDASMVYIISESGALVSI